VVVLGGLQRKLSLVGLAAAWRERSRIPVQLATEFAKREAGQLVGAEGERERGCVWHLFRAAASSKPGGGRYRKRS